MVFGVPGYPEASDDTAQSLFEQFKPLKSSGYVMYRLDIKKKITLSPHSVFIYFVRISEKRNISA